MVQMSVSENQSSTLAVYEADSATGTSIHFIATQKVAPQSRAINSNEPPMNKTASHRPPLVAVVVVFNVPLADPFMPMPVYRYVIGR